MIKRQQFNDRPLKVACVGFNGIKRRGCRLQFADLLGLTVLTGVVQAQCF